MLSTLPKDSNGAIVQRFSPGAASQRIVINGVAGAATKSAAIGAKFIRLHCTVDTLFLFTTATGSDVTASTGHFLPAGMTHDIQMLPGATHISVLSAWSGIGGTCYLSELGTY